MSDDDVEYIGTKNAQRFLIPDHPFPPTSRPLYAVVLNIERCSDKPAYGMWFRKSEFNVVNIGRRPGGITVEKRFENTGSGRAMFRCPVVSRRHAKIVFSETQAYLIDMNSHHGTHILKPGDTVSTILKPETPTLLANNDIVTFGKTVGRGDHVVDPVVVRIGLVYGPHDEETPPTPFISDEVAEDAQVTKAPEPAKTVPKPSSGHYGVHVPCSLVSDESSPGSSNDSDIEELDGPPPSDPALKSNAADNSSQHTAVPAVKSLFGPAANIPVIHIASRSQSPLSRRHSSSPLYDPYSPRFSPPSLSPVLAPWRSWAVSFLELGSPAVPLLPLPSGSFPDVHSRSRSSSPMDLSSPSPSPPSHKEIEPWPLSRSPSPFIFNLRPEKNATDSVVETTAQNADTLAKAIESSLLEVDAPEPRQPSPIPNDEGARLEEVDTGPTKATRDMISTLEEKMSSDIAAMQSNIASMRAEVSKLQVHRRKYKARFNANVHTIAEKLTDLDERIADANVLCMSVSEQIDNVATSELRTTMEAMEARISALTANNSVTADKAEASLDADEVTVSIGQLQAMMTEIKSLRERAKTEMTEDVQAVKAMRKHALVEIASQLETPLNSSLKRKRSDDEGEDEGTSVMRVAADRDGIGSRETVAQSTTKSLVSIAVPSVVQTTRRSTKRLRRMASTVMHTATAMTLGAVATWSALAFS